MGLFSKRRKREGATPESQAASQYKPLADQPVVGQQFTTAAPQSLGNFDASAIMGMVAASLQSAGHQAQVQVSQPQMIDATAGGGHDQLREQMLEVMRAHGIDPDNPAASQPVNSSALPGMQAELMRVLEQNSVDTGGVPGGETTESGDASTAGFDGSTGFDSGGGISGD